MHTDLGPNPSHPSLTICVPVLLWCVLSRSERSFSVVSINAIVFPLIDLYSSIAAGVGFGAMHSFMYYAVIIAHSLGPGALFNAHCPQFSTFFSAAWTALFFNILHICWMILAFDAYRTQFPLKVGVVAVLHAAAAGFVRTQWAMDLAFHSFLGVDVG